MFSLSTSMKYDHKMIRAIRVPIVIFTFNSSNHVKQTKTAGGWVASLIHTQLSFTQIQGPVPGLWRLA